MPQEFVDILIVQRVESDADTRTDRNPVGTEVKGRADGFHDAVGDDRHIRLAGDAFKNGGEFVATHASDCVHLTDTVREARGDGLQELIPDIMSK